MLETVWLQTSGTANRRLVIACASLALTTVPGAVHDLDRQLANDDDYDTSCEDAVDACACAGNFTCGWATDATGNGRCVVLGGTDRTISVVECEFCPSQPHCHSRGCGHETSPCACAEAPQGCRWETAADGGGCIHRVDDDPTTSCSLCPTQLQCAPYLPKVLEFDPENGKIVEGGYASLRVRFRFNFDVFFCVLPPQTNSGIELTCQGMQPETQMLGRRFLSISGPVVQCDISSFISNLNFFTHVDCSLTVNPDIICSEALGVPYAGFSGGYQFRVQDTVPPTLVGFFPRNGESNVALDSTIQISFDEQVFLPEGSLAATVLAEVDGGSYGENVTILSSTQIALSSAFVSIDTGVLKISPMKLMKPGVLHSLSLPPSSLVDRAGNEFAGLDPNQYVFRTSAVAWRSDSELDQGDGMSAAVVFAIVSSVVAIIGSLAVVVARKIVNRKHPSFNTKVAGSDPPKVPIITKGASRAAPTPPESGEPFRASTPTASWATKYPRASVGSAQSGAENWAGPTINQQTKPSPNTPASKKVGGAPPGQQSPSNPASRQSSGQAGPTSGPRPARKKNVVCPASDQDAECRPEVAAVKKQMHDLMDEPLAVRKKALRDLMLEFHPDKNNSEHAKEIFQYINNAKNWFLQAS